MTKKPFDHPDYQIAPGVFNFTRWSRENEPKPPARYKVGDMVLYIQLCEVTKVYKDCDGTPLYALDNGDHGISDDGLLPGHADDDFVSAAEQAQRGLQRMITVSVHTNISQEEA